LEILVFLLLYVYEKGVPKFGRLFLFHYLCRKKE